MSQITCMSTRLTAVMCNIASHEGKQAAFQCFLQYLPNIFLNQFYTKSARKIVHIIKAVFFIRHQQIYQSIV